MQSFEEFKISTPLQNAVLDLGFQKPTAIQTKAFSVILSGRDVVGIAQTGTGKTLAYMLPILQMHSFSKQLHPRVLVLVPTRELVLQVAEEIEKFGKNSSIRVLGVYGGTNMKKQKEAIAEGVDIIVATPGRLYDLVLSRALQLKSIKKLVIDEVDVMLDLGFRFQLTNIFELLPERRQNIMFSATMTDEIDALINDFFKRAEKISVAVSGTPLENISQFCYAVPNFYTKINLLVNLLQDNNRYTKVLVFVSNKRNADMLFKLLEENRIMVTTDVMARGLDLNEISHVINFDTPTFPENYMHRIGRTGRAKKAGTSILFYTEKEIVAKEAIEALMKISISKLELPEELEISENLTPEEQPKIMEANNPLKQVADDKSGVGFHEKKDKNKQTNQGGSYKRIIKQKYKKAKTRGDKNYNKRTKKK